MLNALVLSSILLSPVPEGASDAPVRVEDFAWLAGSWVGTGLGGECDEVWSPPFGGSMLGHFQLLRDGEPQFYELLLLTEDDEGLALKVKHFSPEFSAWEEKDDAIRFGFESLEGQRARFSGLTLERDGERLRIEVRFRNQDGSTRWEPFDFTLRR